MAEVEEVFEVFCAKLVISWLAQHLRGNWRDPIVSAQIICNIICLITNLSDEDRDAIDKYIDYIHEKLEWDDDIGEYNYENFDGRCMRDMPYYDFCNGYSNEQILEKLDSSEDTEYMATYIIPYC